MYYATEITCTLGFFLCILSYFLFGELLSCRHCTVFQSQRDEVLYTCIIFLLHSLVYCFITTSESSNQQVLIGHLLSERHCPSLGDTKINGDDPL